MSEKLLRPTEAAQRLGVCLDTLREMDKRGELKAIRTKGQQRRFRAKDVERLYDEKYKHLRRKEAAELLQVSIDTLFDLEENGILHPILTGGNQRRYDRDEIDKLLESGWQKGSKRGG